MTIQLMYVKLISALAVGGVRYRLFNIERLATEWTAWGFEFRWEKEIHPSRPVLASI